MEKTESNDSVTFDKLGRHVLDNDSQRDELQPWSGFGWSESNALCHRFLSIVARKQWNKLADLQRKVPARAFHWDLPNLSQPIVRKECKCLMRKCQRKHGGISTHELAVALNHILPSDVHLPLIRRDTTTTAAPPQRWSWPG